MDEPVKATMVQVREFFRTGDPDRDKLTNFSAEWSRLSTEDKNDLRVGIGSGTYTY